MCNRSIHPSLRNGTRVAVRPRLGNHVHVLESPTPRPHDHQGRTRASPAAPRGPPLRARTVPSAARSSLPKHQTWLAQGHADAPDSPFYELRLTEAERNAGGAVGRRNYSFLTSPDAQEPTAIDWTKVYDDPHKPLVVDLGCGAGRYVLLMAKRKGCGHNYLGMDVHKALLDRANDWAAPRGLSGCVRYLQAHAVLSAGPLLASYPGPVALVSVQYPDPQQRRQRHIVGRQLVEALAGVLRPGARVYLASDFEDTAAYMRNAFERYGSEHFRVDDVHATQPVFPCDPAAGEAAAQAAKAWRAGLLPAGGQAAQPAEERGASAESLPVGAAAGSSSSTGAGSVGPEGDASSASSGSECADSDGQEEEGEGQQEEEDLLLFRGSWHEAGWLVDNPVGAPTEREVYVEKVTGGRVYRVLLVRR